MMKCINLYDIIIQYIFLANKIVCTPRSNFQNYCNTCKCANDGLSFSCTKMMCDSEIWNQDSTLRISSSPQRVIRSGKIKVH